MECPKTRPNRYSLHIMAVVLGIDLALEFFALRA
jgi:hypothetical protein